MWSVAGPRAVGWQSLILMGPEIEELIRRWPVRSLPLLFAHGPRPQTLLGSRQACRGLSVACPKPASSLHPRAPPANVPAGRSLAQKAFSMGFRRRR